MQLVAHGTPGKFELREVPEPLALPTDRLVPAQQGAEGADYFFAAPADLAPALDAFCRREGVTPYMVLMAGFQALLHRSSGQHQFLVGTPVANRSRVEIEDLIGFFVNTVVLRADPRDEARLHERVDRAIHAGRRNAFAFAQRAEGLCPVVREGEQHRPLALSHRVVALHGADPARQPLDSQANLLVVEAVCVGHDYLA